MTRLAEIIGFTISWLDWVAAGRPRRDPVWVNDLWKICSSCPHFDSKLKTPFGEGGCKLCGCHVSPDAEKTYNKLVWPNESCPDTPPRWSSVVDKPGEES